MQDAFLAMDGFESLEQNQDFDVSPEILASKLRTLGKELFPDFPPENYEFNSFIRITSHLNAYKLPRDFRQIFIPLESAHLYWLTELSAHIYLVGSQQDSLRNFIYDEDFQLIRNYYKKWATAKEGKDKTYFGLSLLNTLKRNFKEDATFSLILSASILIFDKNLRDYAKAKAFLDKLNDVITKSKSDQALMDEAIELVSLYDGFNHLLEDKIEEANYSFFNVVIKNPNSPTGLLYYAYTQKKLGAVNVALEHYEKILKLDVQRLDYAISQNNFSLFVFYIKNNFVANIFYEATFGELFYDVKNVIYTSLPIDLFVIDELIRIINSIKGLEISEFISASLANDIKFVENYCGVVNVNQNIYLKMVIDRMADKAKHILDGIITEINKKINNFIEDELAPYNKQIDDYREKIIVLQKEIEATKGNTQKTLDEEIAEYEKKVTLKVERLESRLKEFEETKQTTSYESFNNSMVINFIISLIVFIFGGFVSSFFSSGGSMNSPDFIRNVFVSGIQWSGIVFILGIIVSVFSYMSKTIEVNTKKNNLIKLISQVKSNKEGDVAEIRKMYEKKETMFVESLLIRITEYEKLLSVVKRDKETRRKILEEENKNVYNKTITDLTKLKTLIS